MKEILEPRDALVPGSWICPKCKRDVSFSSAESLKRIVVVEPGTVDFIDSSITEEFEQETIYIKCNSCGYQAFGPEARLVFGLSPFEGNKFDYNRGGTYKKVGRVVKRQVR